MTHWTTLPISVWSANSLAPGQAPYIQLQLNSNWRENRAERTNFLTSYYLKDTVFSPLTTLAGVSVIVF